MGVMKEDFARCRECDNAYFKPQEAVLISRLSEENSPEIISRGIEYSCIRCGHVQYRSVTK